MLLEIHSFPEIKQPASRHDMSNKKMFYVHSCKSSPFGWMYKDNKGKILRKQYQELIVQDVYSFYHMFL